MKKIVKKLLPLFLTAAMLLSPLTDLRLFGGAEVQVQAASLSASTVKGLVSILREQTMKRETKFSVKFTGTDKAVDYVLGDDLSIIYYDLANLDDAKSSDDADYLVGNIDPEAIDIEYSNGCFKFKFGYFETVKQTEYVNRQVEKILSKLGVDHMTNYEKVKAIHDYVCKITSYKDDADNCSSAYSILSTGDGLCNSYSLLLYKLLVEAGVPCKWLGGTAGTKRDAAGHAWNIVELGNKWYYVDSTWDDLDDEKSWNYDYFLKGSSDFDKVDPSEPHKLDDCYYNTNFLKEYPLAKKAFKKGSDDSNEAVKDTDNKSDGSDKSDKDKNDKSDKNDNKKDIKISDVVVYKIPEKGSMTIKQGKYDDILFLLENESEIRSIKAGVKSGKSYVKTTDYGIMKEDGISFYDLEVKGRKAGSAVIKITVKLKNGESKSYTFKVKVK